MVWISHPLPHFFIASLIYTLNPNYKFKLAFSDWVRKEWRGKLYFFFFVWENRNLCKMMKIYLSAHENHLMFLHIVPAAYIYRRNFLISFLAKNSLNFFSNFFVFSFIQNKNHEKKKMGNNKIGIGNLWNKFYEGKFLIVFRSEEVVW